MNRSRKRRLVLIVFLVTVVASVTALIAYALKQNISLFFTPSDLAKAAVPIKQRIRLGGMVVKGSVHRNTDDLTVEFSLTDLTKTIKVRYRGILPDLFREGQGIVASGELLSQTEFKAYEVLAKHDANYM